MPAAIARFHSAFAVYQAQVALAVSTHAVWLDSINEISLIVESIFDPDGRETPGNANSEAREAAARLLAVTSDPAFLASTRGTQLMERDFAIDVLKELLTSKVPTQPVVSDSREEVRSPTMASPPPKKFRPSTQPTSAVAGPSSRRAPVKARLVPPPEPMASRTSSLGGTSQASRSSRDDGADLSGSQPVTDKSAGKRKRVTGSK